MINRREISKLACAQDIAYLLIRPVMWRLHRTVEHLYSPLFLYSDYGGGTDVSLNCRFYGPIVRLRMRMIEWKGEWMSERTIVLNFRKCGAHGGMILTGENRSATLSTTNPTGANPGRRGERPATNSLRHGTARYFCKIKYKILNWI
jgi:hypothetical protein